MTIILAVIYGLLILALLFVLGIHPQLSSYSRFELVRRAKSGDPEAELLLKRHTLLRDLFSLQRVLAAILLVLLSYIGVDLFHWSVGLLVSFIIALESGAIARLAPLQKISQSIYEKHESKILQVIEKYPLIFRAIRSVSPVPNDAYDIESKAELLEMVKQAGDSLSSNEKKLITNGLTFDSVKVSSIMTPRSMIDTIKYTEILGPLVIDDLYKTGHSRFPVIDKDIDHVVGVLYIQDLLTLKDHRSRKVSTAMDPEVHFIDENKTLDHALASFLRTKHHLFIVTNEFRETVGLISLEDVIEALLGRKITDEFDNFDDLRKLASANPKQNNSPLR